MLNFFAAVPSKKKGIFTTTEEEKNAAMLSLSGDNDVAGTIKRQERALGYKQQNIHGDLNVKFVKNALPPSLNLHICSTISHGHS